MSCCPSSFSKAQARLNEMESNLQQLLATVDRAFKVLIMKTPQSLLSTLLKDAVGMKSFIMFKS